MYISLVMWVNMTIDNINNRKCNVGVTREFIGSAFFVQNR